MAKINLLRKQLHTTRQLRHKERCIEAAVIQFIRSYKSGRLSNPAFLHHEIESLNELVQEYKRG